MMDHEDLARIGRVQEMFNTLIEMEREIEAGSDIHHPIHEAIRRLKDLRFRLSKEMGVKIADRHLTALCENKKP